MSTETDYTVEEIAEECAAFALDNSGDADFAGCQTPAAIWEGWHSKEGIDEPPVHPRFRDLYLDACRKIGGWDLVTEVLTGIAMPEVEPVIGTCDLCGMVTPNKDAECCGSTTCDKCTDQHGCFCSSVSEVA